MTCANFPKGTNKGYIIIIIIIIIKFGTLRSVVSTGTSWLAEPKYIEN